VEIARADLAGTLLQAAAGAGAEILFGDSITALHQEADGVEVRFEVAPPRRFDLVFGADGLHSRVRRLVFGAESRYSRPFGMFIGTVRTTLDTGDRREVLMFNEPGRSLSIHPAGGKPIAAFIFRGHQRYDHRDTANGKRLIERAYTDGGWVTRQVLAEWEASSDVYFDTVTRIVMPSWTSGRISLLGDAASCLSLFGEGSSNAMVAAKTVAAALASHPDDHAAALVAYEDTHRKHLRRFHRGARIASHFLVPATRPGIALRDTGITLASYAGLKR
jgi:2-polyprenyl-6-methoxyphenol hydroxylase-like FAD-dependent oxidoreductase